MRGMPVLLCRKAHSASSSATVAKGCGTWGEGRGEGRGERRKGGKNERKRRTFVLEHKYGHRQSQHTAHSAYSIQHAAYSIQHTAYSIQHTSYIIHRTPYSIQRTAYTIQHTAYTIHHTAYSI